MDNFNKLITGLMLEDPALLDAISDRIAKKAGYSIPTGNIRFSVFDIEDAAKRENIIKAIQAADSLTVGELCKVFAEDRALLIAKEAQGKELKPYEQTIKDIDLSLLSVFALVIRSSGIKHS